VQLSDSDAGALRDLARRYFGDEGDLLESLALLSVRLSRAQPCSDTDTGTRFGGTALLPAGHAWPTTRTGKPLSFLAQVSTADIVVPAEVPGLPGDTLLAFFYEADKQEGWGSDPGDGQFWAVIPVSPADAAAVASPPGSRSFTAYRMVARTVTTIPDYDEPSVGGLDEYDDAFDRLAADLDCGDEAPWHRMFGWPDLLQRAMRLDCQLAAHGLNADDSEDYDSPRAAELAPGAEDWLLLLQLDTDDDIGWMWGDAGTVYFWIRRQDLLAERFDRTWMIFQCC